MAQFVLKNSGPKFYPKNGSFWLFLVNQKLRQKNPVDHKHNSIKVSPLCSRTNFKKGYILFKFQSRFCPHVFDFVSFVYMKL